MSIVQVRRWDGKHWVLEGTPAEMSDDQIQALRLQAAAVNSATEVAQGILTEMRGQLDMIATASGLDADTIERAAMQLHRAVALMDPEYDGWWDDDETEENWRSLLIESERDRYRKVAGDLVAASGGGWPC